jgi:hypothetical protein
MKNVITGFGLTVIAATVLAAPASAQQAGGGQQQRGAEAGRPQSAAVAIERAIERSGVTESLEAIATAASPEIQKAADELATTLGALAARIAGDPELRASAVRAARGMVEVADIVVAEQAMTLQESLRALADRLEALARSRAETADPTGSH